MSAPVGLERAGEQLVERLGPAHVLEQHHPLLVLDALGLHRGDGLALGLALLGVEHGPGVVQRRLDDREHVHRVVGGVAVEQLERRQGERRQWLVQREVEL
jgi:hypothetical protein